MIFLNLWGDGFVETSMINKDWFEVPGTKDGAARHVLIDLVYPDIYSGAGDRTTIEVRLIHTRAGQEIRFSYESARDGWVIEQETQVIGDTGGEWVEVAFLPSWNGWVDDGSGL